MHRLGRLAAERFASNDRAGAIESYGDLEKANHEVVGLLDALIEELRVESLK